MQQMLEFKICRAVNHAPDDRIFGRREIVRPNFAIDDGKALLKNRMIKRQNVSSGQSGWRS